MCVCLCMYMYIYTHIYTYIHTKYIYVCVYRHECICTFVLIYTLTYIFMYKYVCNKVKHYWTFAMSYSMFILFFLKENYCCLVKFNCLFLHITEIII